MHVGEVDGVEGRDVGGEHLERGATARPLDAAHMRHGGRGLRVRVGVVREPLRLPPGEHLLRTTDGGEGAQTAERRRR